MRCNEVYFVRFPPVLLHCGARCAIVFFIGVCVFLTYSKVIHILRGHKQTTWIHLPQFIIIAIQEFRIYG